jgi:hypothetical protein
MGPQLLQGVRAKLIGSGRHIGIELSPDAARPNGEATGIALTGVNQIPA